MRCRQRWLKNQPYRPVDLSRRQFMHATTSCLIGYSFSLTSNALTPEQSQDEVALQERRLINDLITSFMNINAIPALSLAFFRNNQLLYSAAFGTADRKLFVPALPTTRFRIASNSKAYTAAAIFTLLEAGRLRLDDHVFSDGGVLQLYTDRSTSDVVKRVKIYHLLTHTSGGWSNESNDPMFSFPDLDQDKLIRHAVRTDPLTHDPGEHYAYSNFGYCLLGRIIERVSNMSYPDYVKKSVLDPSGIKDMQLASDKRAPGEAVYYASPGDADPYSFPISRMDSHGGWIATAEDQARFLAKLFSPQDQGTSRGIISLESLRIMTSGTSANPSYACGLAVNKYGNNWHFGSLPGTTSLMVHTHRGLSWGAVLNTRRNHSKLENDLDDLMWKIARSNASWQA